MVNSYKSEADAGCTEWGLGLGAGGWGLGLGLGLGLGAGALGLASSCPTYTGYDPPASLPLGPEN